MYSPNAQNRSSDVLRLEQNWLPYHSTDTRTLKTSRNLRECGVEFSLPPNYMRKCWVFDANYTTDVK